MDKTRAAGRHPPVHYVLPLISLAIPVALIYFLRDYLKAHHHLAPLLNGFWLIALCCASWWWGYAGAILFSCLVIVTASLAATGHWIAPQLSFASTAITFGIALAVSSVAAGRRKVESVLRSANEQLETKVRERTAELEQAHDWLKTTLASIGDAVIATDAAGKVLLMNGVASALTGWPAIEAAGKPIGEIFVVVNEETRAPVESPVENVLRTGSVTGLSNHTVLIARDGRELPVDDSAAPIRGAHEKLAGAVLIFREIGDRRRAERERERLLRETGAARAAAEEQRAQLHSVFMQAPAIVNIHRGPDHVFELVHPLMKRLTGGRRITGLPLREALPEIAASGALAACERVYRTGISETALEFRAAAADNAVLYFNLLFNCWHDLDGSVAGVIVLALDVTEQVLARREMEMSQERLRETARLESLGVLAGGIAHDFNNLLVGIMGNASLALDMVPRSNPACAVIEDLQRASEKAALLTRQMLAYSGKGRFIIEPVDLSELTEEILPLISRSTPPSVVVRPLLGKQLPRIEADRAQLHQVIMNLVINAAEACGDSQGIVTVVTSVQRPERPAPAAFGLPPAQSDTFVALEVSDTGCGMSDEVRAKIFDPFFTTKFTGRGLGLSAVLGIIRAHKGAIAVDTAPGKGTTFRVLFPAPVEPLPDSAALPLTAARDLAGSGIVLVIDDEEMVRRVARLTLERFGYTVALAANGQSGVEVFRSMQDRILAVVLDLTMPVMGGEETLAELKRIDPDVRVILSTGYSESETTKRFAGRGLAGFLQKPFTAAQLADEVKNVLATSCANPKVG
jgi:PAS domain S-box-containing protein